MGWWSLEHDRCRLCSAGWLQRWLYLYDTRVLMMDVDAQSTHFFLYGRQHGHDGRQSVLVLGHQSPDVLDVGPLLDVILDVALYVLQPYVEDPQGPLDRVELRHGQQLDVRWSDRRASRRMYCTSVYHAHRGHRHILSATQNMILMSEYFTTVLTTKRQVKKPGKFFIASYLRTTGCRTI